jgi:hypothetical protein
LPGSGFRERFFILVLTDVDPFKISTAQKACPVLPGTGRDETADGTAARPTPGSGGFPGR